MRSSEALNFGSCSFPHDPNLKKPNKTVTSAKRTYTHKYFLFCLSTVVCLPPSPHSSPSLHPSLPTCKPCLRSYYELAAASLRFKFPNPGPLDGITSTTKNILTMKDCTYQYPGSARAQIQGASLKLCLASRVGVTGVNGAGKTTLIKMVVRETEPDSGEVRG